MHKILYTLAIVVAFGSCALAEAPAVKMWQQQVDRQLEAQNTAGVISIIRQMAQSGAADFREVLNYVVAEQPALSTLIIDALKAIDPGLAAQALASVILMLEDMGENTRAAALSAQNQDLIDVMTQFGIQPAGGTTADDDVLADERGFAAENPNQQGATVRDGDAIEAPVTLF